MTFYLCVDMATICDAKEQEKNSKHVQHTKEKLKNSSKYNRKSQEAIKKKFANSFYEPGQNISLGGND